MRKALSPFGTFSILSRALTNKNMHTFVGMVGYCLKV